ncbi:MAG: DNA translocase FtsK 4TM domain-containing protein, partial [Methylococcales bacterium]|nr:DNA translocase FtsK 4TM domain-containing protein [Methylococcales bacterium]
TRGGTRKRKPASKRKSSSPRKRKPATRRKPKSNFSLDWPQKALIIGIATIFATAVLVLSLLSPNQGQLTSGLATIMWQLFGWGGFVAPLVSGTIGLYLVLWGMDQAPTLPTFRLIGLGLLFLAAEGLATLLSLMADNELHTVWEVAKAQIGGGYLGGLMAYTFNYFVGDLGAILTLVVIGFIGTSLLSGLSRNEIGAWITNLFNRSSRTVTEKPKRGIRVNPGREPRPKSGTPRQLPLSPALLDDKDEDADETEKPKRKSRIKRNPARKAKPKATEPAAQPTIVSPVFLGGGQPGGASWTLPVISEMLKPGTDSGTNDTAIREQVEIIEHTLESFGAPATVVEINQGPTITQFGVEPNYIVMRNGRRTKVKVGKIAGLADDISLALAARSIRIQAPVPGKGYVGIEVPNPAKALVSLRDVMETSTFRKIKTPLGIALGQNVAGQPIVADLASMPHMLVAGTTGSGKSVLINGIIACLLLQNTPDNLKLVMVDPKRVELTGYNGIPHLAAPVVVEMDRVISTLQWALREMDTRYKIFASVGARNIIDYNKKVRRKKDAEKMPYIVIIIDELADLMMLAPEDTERSITRLAQMARATGMHMVIA